MLFELKNNPFFQKGFFFPERLVPLHCMLINCGYMECRENYVWDSMRRGSKPMVVWQFTVSGRGRFRHGKHYYDLPPGSGFIADIPGDNCYFLPDDSDYWEMIYISMLGSEAIRLLKELVKKNGPVFRLDDESRTLEIFMDIFRLAQKGKIDNAFGASNLGYNFIMGLYEDVLLGDWDKKRQPEFILKVINFCMGHIANAVSIDEMADISGLSRFHFSREFKKYTGLSPMAYMNELRVKRATRMLQVENKTVKEIAFECGYEDLSYFTKVFKKSTGITPAGFRNAKHKT
ncbi:MAG: AraC family transcriptional regulator [Victivallales bacterium]|nr:AraC family transcriptional regulator [Victivallales bacterium]